MPSDSPLPKTNFLFHRTYHFQITFWLGVGLVSPQCWDFVWLAYVQYCAFCCSPQVHMCSVLLCLEEAAFSESLLLALTVSASSEPGGESSGNWDSLSQSLHFPLSTFYAGFHSAQLSTGNKSHMALQ